jgi:protein gp37
LSYNTSIQWTNSSWNPIAGCSRTSPGCSHCYAIGHVRRLGSNPNPKVAGAYRGLTGRHDNGQLDWTGELRVLPERLELPLTWKAPRRIFVNSLSDLFHEAVPASALADVFFVMRQADWHQFQILTKRSERLHALAPLFSWPSHIWMGVSVENAAYTSRIDHLRDTPAAVKFLSLEPLLGPLPALNLTGIDWVIVGGESGPHARLIQPSWVRDIRDQCVAAQVPFFMKQWGGMHKKAAGRMLDGRTWDEMPELGQGALPAPKQLALFAG